MDIGIFKELTGLPWYFYVSIVSGYLGYINASRGLRQLEQKKEMFLKVLLHGIISLFVYSFFKDYLGLGLKTSTSLTLLSSVFIGILWNRFRNIYFEILRFCNVSNENDSGTILNSLHMNEKKHHVESITVVLKDGTKHTCDLVQDLRNCVVGGYDLDDDGNFALMVTRTLKPDNSEWIPHYENGEVIQDNQELLYIPSDNIKKIFFTYKRRD